MVHPIKDSALRVREKKQIFPVIKVVQGEISVDREAKRSRRETYISSVPFLWWTSEFVDMWEAEEAT